ncbi:rhodanese-like domain-containing protein [Cohnella hongkongensis]|uniref:Rhodanese-like domain-containing protein n=1 Tax=Cohnella hongkongensis TaxID=178337 RepID=A0ABV9FJF1_9BACL
MAGKYSKDILPDEVKHRLEQGEKLQVVDVREPDEWTSGHIPGARHIPLGSIHQRHIELDLKQEYIIVCRSGGRSSLACELLEGLGYKVANMPGGMLEWDGDVSYD